MDGSDRHADTLAVYERRAGEWATATSARTGEVAAFVARLDSEPDLPAGVLVDLGSGPGGHLPHLPPGTVALDAANAMLEMAATATPDTPLVQADLRALPFADRCLRGAWASRSYVHVDRRNMPMALWDLHRCMATGGLAGLTLFGGDADHEGFDGDRFAGRSFSLWPQDLLTDVLEGAGFSTVSLDRSGPDACHEGDPVPDLLLTLRRERTLADTVGAGMRLLLVGLNPSLHAADSGVGFSGPTNRGWPALLEAGLATVDRDPVALLSEQRIGMTDMVKRATARASELHPDEYRRGLERLDRLCAWLQPAAVCVVGLAGWRTAVDRSAVEGIQDRHLGGRPVYLMPNPSGLNAHVSVTDLAASLSRAVELAQRAS